MFSLNPASLYGLWKIVLNHCSTYVCMRADNSDVLVRRLDEKETDPVTYWKQVIAALRANKNKTM